MRFFSLLFCVIYHPPFSEDALKISVFLAKDSQKIFPSGTYEISVLFGNIRFFPARSRYISAIAG